jgi:CRISPR-associated endonuclease/helicase Cas3
VPHLLLLWAKLGQADFAERHPVICHLLDVASVALRLWGNVLRDALKQRLAASLGLPPDAAGRWLAFWAGAHDIGKVSPGFQAKNPQAKEALGKAGVSFAVPDDTPHGTVSAAVLPKLLHQPGGWPGIPESLARQVAVAVGGHHGVFPGARACRLGAAVLGDTKGTWHGQVALAAALLTWVAAAPLAWILLGGLGPGMVESTGARAVVKFLGLWGGAALALARSLAGLSVARRRLSR